MQEEIFIKHYIKGRVRLKSIYFSNSANLNKIKRVLSKQVREFRVNIKTNSITILFNEAKLSLQKLISLIERAFNIEPKEDLKTTTNNSSLFSIFKNIFTFGLTSFGVIKSYFFGIKQVTDTTLNFFKFVKYIRVI